MSQKQKTKSRNWKRTSLGVATFLILTFSFSAVSAQESLNATGGKASGSGGTVSYSVGQVEYLTKFSRSGLKLEIEGVQQPYEISAVNGPENLKGINLSVTAYPNPTSYNLILGISDAAISNLSYQLYDMQGSLLEHKKITGRLTTIEMSTLGQTIYFLKVLRDAVVIKTFKIIKSNN